jgi:hypothetical protein
VLFFYIHWLIVFVISVLWRVFRWRLMAVVRKEAATVRP